MSWTEQAIAPIPPEIPASTGWVIALAAASDGTIYVGRQAAPVLVQRAGDQYWYAGVVPWAGNGFWVPYASDIVVSAADPTIAYATLLAYSPNDPSGPAISRDQGRIWTPLGDPTLVVKAANYSNPYESYAVNGLTMWRIAYDAENTKATISPIRSLDEFSDRRDGQPRTSDEVAGIATDATTGDLWIALGSGVLVRTDAEFTRWERIGNTPDGMKIRSIALAFPDNRLLYVAMKDGSVWTFTPDDVTRQSILLPSKARG